MDRRMASILKDTWGAHRDRDGDNLVVLSHALAGSGIYCGIHAYVHQIFSPSHLGKKGFVAKAWQGDSMSQG